MFDRAGFEEFFFREIGASRTTLNTYNSYLGRIDQIVGGLDEKITNDGGEELLLWMSTAKAEPFASHRSQARSITRAYIRYRTSEPAQIGVIDDEPTAQEAAASVFRYERELQRPYVVNLRASNPIYPSKMTGRSIRSKAAGQTFWQETAQVVRS